MESPADTMSQSAIATTGWSAPEYGIGTLVLTGSLLEFFP
jgi:hypothetical protein